MFSEFVDGYAKSKQGRKGWVDWKIDDALSLHPNYINLLGWQGADARDFMAERPDLIARGLRTMGYRFVPTRVQFPAVIQSGRPFTFASEWINRGVGRPMRNYTLRLTLLTAEGKVAATADAGPTGCHQWVKDKTYTLQQSVKFTELPPGTYVLHLSLIDPKVGAPIALPLTQGDDAKRYKLGAIDAR